MNTLEATYIFSISFLVIATLINGAIHLQSKINAYTRTALESEIDSHKPDGEKIFKPENFIREISLFEQDKDPAEKGET
ncbi:hypothetical protein [Oribacterium sp. WCC10]|uniref:hypothetical protein n=1 Tax=Oribacterium sp. WCC10 TaxID=1855343 RepID=UPI0008E5436F|nr:hypothetical protein [Oribacterium sp. WCC10]SFG33967.1 hypothetical protein SAMN05216356_10635 [Oribacterium sp. WCC10]